jgi:hypothetical protein
MPLMKRINRIATQFLLIFCTWLPNSSWAASVIDLQAVKLERELTPFLGVFCSTLDCVGDRLKSLYRIQIESSATTGPTLIWDRWTDGKVTRLFSAPLSRLPKAELGHKESGHLGIAIARKDTIKPEFYGEGGFFRTAFALNMRSFGPDTIDVHLRRNCKRAPGNSDGLLIRLDLRKDDYTSILVFEEASRQQKKQSLEGTISPLDFVSGNYVASPWCEGDLKK